MEIKDLRPGMENVDLKVNIIRLEQPREITTYSGVEHILVEGEIKDRTGKAAITIWNDQIDRLEEMRIIGLVELKNCFISSFKGVIQVNIGRDSEIIESN